MIWDWLHRIIYRREIAEECREIDAMSASWNALREDLDRSIAETFTPEEWAAVCARNRAANV